MTVPPPYHSEPAYVQLDELRCMIGTHGKNVTVDSPEVWNALRAFPRGGRNKSACVGIAASPAILI